MQVIKLQYVNKIMIVRFKKKKPVIRYLFL